MALKKQKKTLLTLFKNLAVLCLMVYAVIVIVSQQVELSSNKKNLAEIKSKISVAQQSNDEYLRLLSLTDEKEYMERIAIEKMGYAYPNERRFFDTSRN